MPLRTERLVASGLRFSPELVNSRLTRQVLMGAPPVPFADYHDYLLLQVFSQRERMESLVPLPSPEAAFHAKRMMDACARALENRWDSRWACRARSHLLELLHLMDRSRNDRYSVPGPLMEDRCTGRFCGNNSVEEALRLIQENYGSPGLTADKVIRTTGSSRTRMNQEFHRVTGLSVYQYILEYRVHAAARLLTYTSMTIEEIARRTGFANASCFSACFKRRRGCSPSGYRHNSRWESSF